MNSDDDWNGRLPRSITMDIPPLIDEDGGMNKPMIVLSFFLSLWGVFESRGADSQIDGKKVTITRIDDLPVRQDQYTRRFKFDAFENLKLKDLRTRYRLDNVIALGKTEFDQQVLLNDWVHRQFKKFGHPSTDAKGALEILDGIEKGNSFFCAQYADLLISSAASLGWIDRGLALRRHQGVNAHGGSTEHSTTEIWSNEYRKWVMLDPTSNMYLERDDVPLNAWEIRQEWFYGSGKNLVFVVGKERARYHKKDLPIFLEHFADFGDLTIDPDELDKYGFIGYIPNTDAMDSGPDYGQMFIVKDQLCAGTKWHERLLPANPGIDPYFPINQAHIEVRADSEELIVKLGTFTPNFKRFESKIDGGAWKESNNSVSWKPHMGTNQFRARVVNAFGVIGPESLAEAVLEP